MDKFLNLADLAHFWGRIKAKLDGKQNALVSGTNIKTINNENLLGSGNIDIHGDDVFVAVYEQTSYADVTAAIDANKVIMLDMPANHNLFNITHATYTNGGNAIMYAIFKMNNRSTLMTATLTPAGIWTVVHTDLQDKLVSGTNIKTINNQSLLGSGNIDVGGGGGGDNVFIAKIDQTTEAELTAAFNSGKEILINFGAGAGIAPALKSHVGLNGGFILYAMTSLGGNIPTVNWVTFQVVGSTWTAITVQNLYQIIDQAYDGTSVNAQSGVAMNPVISNLQSQIDALGEPFRVKQWATNTLNVTIPTCTTDIANTQIGKITFTISGEEGDNFQIVGMIAYEIFDAATGGNRINCWPVCQFTGNGQKELSVRWMCGGTTDKVAKRINAWVLLKHR